jgi:peptidyl-prolyl cis-trans isomerase D
MELIKAKMTGISYSRFGRVTAGSTVLQATDVIMENPMLTGVGLEPKVVGNASALKQIKCLHQ